MKFLINTSEVYNRLLQYQLSKNLEQQINDILHELCKYDNIKQSFWHKVFGELDFDDFKKISKLKLELDQVKKEKEMLDNYIKLIAEILSCTDLYSKNDNYTELDTHADRVLLKFIGYKI